MRGLRGLLPVATALLLALSACTGGDSGEDPPENEPSDSSAGSLLVWTDSSRLDAVRGVVEEYGDAHDVSVKVQAVSSGLQEAFAAADAGGQGPDVVVGGHDWIGTLVEREAIVPLDLAPEDLSGFSPTAVRATTYDGQLYGLPFGVEAVGLYRNTDLAPKAPVSMDAVVADGRLALPVGEDGDAYYLQGLYTSLGGYLFGTDAEGAYDGDDLGIGEAGSLAAARKLASLGEQEAGVLSRDVTPESAIKEFTKGEAAYLVTGPWALSEVRESGVPFEVSPLPGFRGQGAAEPFMSAQSFMVAAGARNSPNAQELVSALADDEDAMRALHDNTGLPPAMTSVAEAVGGDALVFYEATGQAAPIPALPEMAAVWSPLAAAYAAIIEGAPAESAMREAGRAVAAAIAG